MISTIALALPLNDSSVILQVLLDVAIKGAVILLGVKILLMLLRQTSATLRHLIWCGAVCGLLALPFFTIFLPTWQVPILPSQLSTPSASTGVVISNAVETTPYQLPDMSAPIAQEPSNSEPPVYSPPIESYKQNWNSLSPVLKSDVPAAKPSVEIQRSSTQSLLTSFDWESFLLFVWLAGVLVVSTRVVVGITRVWWLARGAERLTDISWEMMFHNLSSRLQLRNQVTLRKSEQVTLPMTCGLLRPVVLLPEDSERWSLRCRRIVLLHELAHVKRRDCLSQLFAQLACALYWFNPLVWGAARHLRVERELACDDQVLEAGTRASDYASYLVEIARTFGAKPEVSPAAVGMACSELESRVRAILAANSSRKTMRFSQVLLTFTFFLCLIIPLALVQPRTQAQARLGANSSKAPKSTDKNIAHQDAGSSESTMGGKVQMTVPEENKHMLTSTHTQEVTETHTVETRTTQDAKPKPNEEAEEDDRDVDQDKDQNTETKEKRSSNPSAEDLIRMKRHDITPEFIESVRKLGFENLSVNRLVEMRIHNINEEFIKEVRSWGYDNLTLNQLLQLRIAGVNSAYVAAMKGAGFNNLSANKLASLKLQNVTPEYIEMLRRNGYDNLTADQLLTLRVHGVTEEFIRDTANWGYGKLSYNDLVQVRIFDVTPAYAREMKSIGIDNVPLKKLSQMKLHGVTVEFVKEMRGLGLENLTVDQLIQMRIHGVTADYVRRLRAAGFKNVSVNQMIEMKISGVDEILLKKSQ